MEVENNQSVFTFPVIISSYLNLKQKTINCSAVYGFYSYNVQFDQSHMAFSIYRKKLKNNSSKVFKTIFYTYFQWKLYISLRFPGSILLHLDNHLTRMI